MNGEISYPEKRERFFAQRCLRAFVKTSAAQDLGADGLALLTVIVTQEDAKRYRGPVTFYNDQLMSVLGIRKWDRLDAVRKRLIDAGWLVYIPPPSGRRGRPGQYWGQIPASVADIDDGPIDEGDHTPKTDTVKPSKPSPKTYPKNGDGTRKHTLETDTVPPKAYPNQGYGRGYGQGELTYPIPIPNNSLSDSLSDHTPKTDTVVPRRHQFRLAGRWNTPEVVAALQLWARHYESQNPGEFYSDIMADSQCQDASRRGWKPADLIENITHSIAKGCRKTIIDRTEANRFSGQANSGGSGTKKIFTAPLLDEESPR